MSNIIVNFVTLKDEPGIVKLEVKEDGRVISSYKIREDDVEDLLHHLGRTLDKMTKKFPNPNDSTNNTNKIAHKCDNDHSNNKTKQNQNRNTNTFKHEDYYSDNHYNPMYNPWSGIFQEFSMILNDSENDDVIKNSNKDNSDNNNENENDGFYTSDSDCNSNSTFDSNHSDSNCHSDSSALDLSNGKI